MAEEGLSAGYNSASKIMAGWHTLMHFSLFTLRMVLASVNMTNSDYFNGPFTQLVDIVLLVCKSVLFNKESSF
jgi:hypothetical protein